MPSSTDSPQLSLRTPRRNSFRAGRLVFCAAVLISASVLVSTAVHASNPTLVDDLYPGSEAAFKFNHTIAALGNSAVFDGASTAGIELMITDGSPLGTQHLRDIFPGPDGSVDVGSLVSLDGLVIFQADDGVHGRELWVSDGTLAGTEILLDIEPGPADSIPNYLYSDGVHVYFQAWTSAEGPGVWISDGTSVGTLRLKSLASPDSPAIAVVVSEFTSVGSQVYFEGLSNTGGYELFVTDGTPGGTVQVADIHIGIAGSNPSQFTALGATVLFSADDGINGRELWKSDGTALGTVRVAEIHPTGSASPSILGTLGSEVLFAADDGVSGRQLYKTDGNVAGQIATVSGGVDNEPGAVLGGRLYFAADDGDGVELWRTNGTTAGTGQVADISPGASSSDPNFFRALGAGIFFAADDGVHGVEPWVTNGTTTQMVADLDGAATDSLSPVTTLGGGAILPGDRLLFSAGATGRKNLWITDGSAIGTTKLTDHQVPSSSAPSSLVAWQAGAAFIARNDVLKYALYTSDGAPNSAVSTGFLAPGPSDTNQVGEVAVAGGRLFVTNLDSSGGPQVDLWMWDGSTAQIVAEDFSSFLSQGPKYLTEVDGALFFTAGSFFHRNDGLAVGPADSGEIPGAPKLCVTPLGGLVALGSKILYGGNQNGDCELWALDASDDSATQVKDFDPATSSSPRLLGTWNGLAFLQLLSGQAQYELWVTNGTAAGTIHLTPAMASNILISVGAVADGFLWVDVDQGQSHLWTSDGTPAGTSLVVSTPTSTGFLRLLASGDSGAYFVGADGVWFTDGTAVGTLLVAAGLQNTQAPVLWGDDLVVAATRTAGEGRELFLVQGPDGTFEALPDVEPGAAGTSVENALVVGDTLYLSAFRKDVGTELFSLDLSPFPATLFADDFELGTLDSWTAIVP